MGRKKGARNASDDEEEETVPHQKKQNEEQSKDNEPAAGEFVPIAPKKVVYCPVCNFPFELCSLGKKVNECIIFLRKFAPDKVQKYHPNFDPSAPVEAPVREEVEDKNTKPKLVKEKLIVVTVSQRQKKKFITTVSGLETMEIDAKTISKKLSKQLSSNCSVAKEGTISLQGDFSEEIKDILVNEYKIKKKYIVDGDEVKLKLADEKAKKKQQREAEVEEPPATEEAPPSEEPKQPKARHGCVLLSSDEDE